MSFLSSSSGSGSSASSKISVKKSPSSSENDVTDDQLALIQETLDLIMWEKYGYVLEGDELSEIIPEDSQSTQSPESPGNSLPDISEKQQYLIFNVTDVQEKISRCLFDIQSHLRKCFTFQEDEEDEARRRRRRFDEFSTRLSRNYLYQVTCLIAEIPSTSHRRLLSKTNQLFTEIHHALRFYCNNMVNYSNEMQKKKLKETVEVVQNGIKVCLRENIFDQEDELVKKISEMCLDVIEETEKCFEVIRKVPKKASKSVSGKKKSSVRRSSSANPLAMYLPTQQSPKKISSRSTPSFRLNLQGSDDEGSSRESSAKLLDTVTTDDRLKCVEEPQLETSHARPRTMSTRDPDTCRRKSRTVSRKDRASSRARRPSPKEFSTTATENGGRRKKLQKSSLDGVYREIGKEIVDIVGEHAIKSVFLLKLPSRH